MNKQYKTYPKYKKTGIEWLGDIPEGWLYTKIKYEISCIESGKREQTDLEEVLSIGGEHIQDGSIVIKNPRYVSQTFYDNIKKGKIAKNDILMVKDGATIGKMAFVDKELIAPMLLNEHVFKFCANKFYYYFLISNYSQSYIWYMDTSSAQEGISQVTIKNLPFFSPTSLEQEKIAKFLDAKVGDIDTLVSKLEKQLQLIDEQRNSLITQAVCRGVNTKTPMKDSGIKWLGKIPKHWEAKKLKYVVTINPEVLSEATDEDYEIEYIDIGSVSLLNGIENKQEFLFKDAPSRARRKVKSGDTIVSTVRTYLKAITYIESVNENTIASTGFAVIRPSQFFNSKYLGYFLTNHIFINEVMAYSNGVSYPAINSSEIGNFCITIPPLSEQKEIVEYLDEKLSKIDLLKEKNTKQIELLKEYKTSLITNAVTGKIDVRNEVI